ncbi:MAG: aldolase/citrate lyase family protein [Methylophilaceae bacterium]
MNKTEKEMLEILNNLRKSGAIAVKAEFEAEGTRTEELLRLIELSRRANIGIGLKIGGCEAVRDLIEAKQFGVDYVIAPMVETPYAIEKYIEAKNKVFSQDEREDVDFLVNIETQTGFNNSDQMIKVASSKNGIDGIVFGRVDFVGSQGLPLDSINEDNVTNSCIKIANQCKKNKLDFVVGGGVSDISIKPLSLIKENHLTRFETRKIIFEANALNKEEIKKALLNAVHFELLWLLNKRKFYSLITGEDNKRLKMLNDRWKLINNQE